MPQISPPEALIQRQQPNSINHNRRPDVIYNNPLLLRLCRLANLVLDFGPTGDTENNMRVN
jgi:hypothetical protein